MEKYLCPDLINIIDEYSGKKQRQRLIDVLNISEENFNKLTNKYLITGDAIIYALNDFVSKEKCSEIVVKF